MRLDPYAALGLPAGAPIDEVKRAYRTLAKRYHPDSGGDEATTRFLAVQAAYEAILGGSDTGRATGPPAGPWQADPGRARATRETYRRSGRGSRAGAWGRPGTSEGATSGAPEGGTAGDAGDRTSNGRRSGSWWAGGPDRSRRAGAGSTPNGAGGEAATGAGPDASGGATHGAGSGASGPGTTGRSRRRSPTRRKATLTSTSYDEAVQGPFEPDWQGGSWYGTTSGTYWTLNPREYADPRKHGPEYQARSRRGGTGPVPGPGPSASGPTRPEPSPPGADPEPSPPGADPVAGSEDPAGAEPVAPAPGDRRPGSGVASAWRTPEARGPGATGRGPGSASGAASGSTSPVAIGVAAGGIALVPSAVLLLGAGPTASSAMVGLALVLPFAAAVVAGLATVVIERDRD